ncbi:MAG: membrane protein insertase YidC [Spirochaetota bacterium]|nr:MAG: membrane protein insertase YidC [Spirochaetota bacterium]
MDKNTILAIVVIFVIIFLFQLLYLRPRMEQQQRAAQEAIEEPAEVVEYEEEVEEIEEEKPEIVQVPVPAEGAQKKVISIDTQNYTAMISTEGASIISFQLKNYLDQNDAPIELVQYTETDIMPFELHFNRLREISSGDRTLYYVEQLSEYAYVFYRDFEDKNGYPFRLSKTYFFQDNEYMFDIKISVTSLSGDDLYINQDNISYTLAWGPVLGPTSVIRNRYNITTQGYHENRKFRKIMRGAGGCSMRRSEARYTEVSKIIDWLGIRNRYFFIGIIPDAKNYIFAFDQRQQGKYFIGISNTYFRGKEFEDNFRIYAGPMDRKLLKKYGNNFESVKGSRILKPIVVFLELMIKLFYSWVHNYGIAIILMTIVIKIILYPLTQKSFKSMRRMSALQPKITEIRERYKNNPQQMNREVQNLYRKEKVNPMGGCLPMVLQLPIFYALYTLLSGMIELRNESFLWIKDLSLPDTVATIRAMVPLLGYRIEGQGLTDINILPFIMTGTTLLQSKLTSGDQTAQQGKMMTYLFPIVFFFIFWNMPSGLVLYWTIQNILTIGQQYIIDYNLKKKKLESPPPPAVAKKKKRRSGMYRR